MGWIGFGIGMGFRTARYGRYAVRSGRRCHSQRSGSAGLIGFLIAAPLIWLLVSIGGNGTGSAGTYVDPVETYGLPGKYGYGLDSITRKISGINAPPGQIGPGHTVFRVTFPARTVAAPTKASDGQTKLAGGIILVAVLLVAGLALFLPLFRASPPQPPTPEISLRGPQGPPPGDDGPLNPRMYYSNRR